MNESTLHPTGTEPGLSEQREHLYTRPHAAQGRMTGTAPSPSPGRGVRSGEALSRADRFVITMLAALLGSTLVGFVAIGGQLLGLQRQIGELRVEMHDEIGGLSERLTRVETLLQTRESSGPTAPLPSGL